MQEGKVLQFTTSKPNVWLERPEEEAAKKAEEEAAKKAEVSNKNGYITLTPVTQEEKIVDVQITIFSENGNPFLEYDTVRKGRFKIADQHSIEITIEELLKYAGYFKEEPAIVTIRKARVVELKNA